MHTYHNTTGECRKVRGANGLRILIKIMEFQYDLNHQGNICEEEKAQIIHPGGGTSGDGGEGHL
jgi:hypothetical protein